MSGTGVMVGSLTDSVSGSCGTFGSICVSGLTGGTTGVSLMRMTQLVSGWKLCCCWRIAL